MMIKTISKVSIPLAVALVAIIAIYFLLPAGVDASDAPAPEGVSLLDSALPVLPPPSISATTIGGTDLPISLGSGSIPEIAANGTFAAVVYVENNNVYLVSGDATDAGWRRTLVASAQGAVSPVIPRVAFSGNDAHVVWNSSDGQYIRHVACTLVAGASPKCGVVSGIYTDTVGAKLYSPDIVIDTVPDPDMMHVAWFDDTANRIKTARATAVATTTVPTWNKTDGVSTGIIANFTNYSNPAPVVLAASNTYVHVAFLAKNISENRWEVRHYRLATSNHTVDGAGSHDWASTALNIGRIFNPSIAAVGSNVYLSWDSWHKGAEQVGATQLTKTIYNLFGVKNINEGNDGNWGSVQHITSTHATGTEDPVDYKFSQEKDGVIPDATPVEEVALRPSLAVNGSAFSIVWQERPSATGGSGGSIIANATNCTSEIFYASPDGSWTSSDQLADDTANYSIDPDLAIDANGQHFVFMKAVDAGCAGGSSTGYTINYRGPYQGSFDAGISPVYLPIVLK